MAATAAYVSVTRIPLDGVPSQNHTDSNINATGAAFKLAGGKYGVSVIASTFGTVTLQVLGADASTWLTAATAFAANGYSTVDLPPGSYRIALA